VKTVSCLSDVPYTTAYWDIPPQLQCSTEEVGLQLAACKTISKYKFYCNKIKINCANVLTVLSTNTTSEIVVETRTFVLHKQILALFSHPPYHMVCIFTITKFVMCTFLGPVRSTVTQE
jgi:hypothetical protein